MDGSVKGFSPKPSPVANPTNSGAGESNENELSSTQETGAKMHNSKKPLKHFMSSTISAASKAATPKKKILGERNQDLTFSDARSQKSPNVESRTDPLNSRKSNSVQSSPRVMSSSNWASGSDDDENNSFVVDSSLRPYDPLTNYLSPRPKYLRYKPNRKREIICRLEIERGEEEDGIDVKSSDDFDSPKNVDEEPSSADALNSSPLPLESIVKPDDEEETEKKGSSYGEVEDDEEEIEEFEEERGWSLKGIMKLLLLIFALSFSTSYILSMNSPPPSYAQHAIWSLQDGYHRIQEHLLKDVVVKIYGDGNGSQDQVEALVMGALTVDQRIEEDEEFEMVEYLEDDAEEEVGGTGDEQLEMVEPVGGHSEHAGAHQVDEIVEEPDQLILAEIAKSQYVYCDQAEIKSEDDSDQLLGPGVADHDEDIVVDHDEDIVVDHEVDKRMSGLDHNEDADDLKSEPEEEIGKHYESFEGSQAQSHSEMVDNHNSVNDNESNPVNKHAVSFTEGDPVFERQVKPIIETNQETIELENKVQRSQDLIINTYDEIIVSGSMEDALTESGISSCDSDDGSMEIKDIETGSVLIPVTVVFFSSILASLVSIYRSMRTRVVDKHSHQPHIKPIESSVTTETLTPLVPRVEEKQIEKKVESFGKPSSLFNPSEKIPKHTSHILAPEVALLGELVIGDRSSSLRTCEMKTKIIESQESNKLPLQEEKILQFATRSASPPERLSAVGFSTTDLPSYGSFTAEKKTLKKEKCRGAGVEAAVTTPVRRSTRLLNRSVMSP